MKRTAAIVGFFLSLAVSAAAADWLAGDFHVHTVFSGDVAEIPPSDPDTFFGEDVEQLETWGWSPAEQVLLAQLRGLDFVSLTDHNTVAQQADPGHTAGPLDPAFVVIPAYENSLARGHGGMQGATALLFDGADSAPDNAALNDLLAAHRAAGGVFVINHPRERQADDSGGNPWQYGSGSIRSGLSGLDNFAADSSGKAPDYALADGLEVMNIHWLWRREIAGNATTTTNNPEAVRFWEELLNRGYRVAAVGGSDNHWRSTHAVQGVGQPTTWVLAEAKTQSAIFDGVRANHTFVAWQPPTFSGPRLFLETGCGAYGCQAMAGDQVAAPAAGEDLSVRVRIENGQGLFLQLVVRNPAAGAHCSRVASGGGACSLIVHEEPIVSPVQTVDTEVAVPSGAANFWVRADLAFERSLNDAAIDDLFVAAITSVIYVGNRQIAGP